MEFHIGFHVRRKRSVDGNKMNSISNIFGPYAKFVHEDGTNLIDSSNFSHGISYELVSGEDYVSHYSHFCNFIEAYFSDLTSTPRDCVLLTSSLATVSHLNRGYADSLIARISERFDALISCPESDVADLDAIMAALRIAIERRCPINSLVKALVERLEYIIGSPTLEAADDVISILHNNRDVLERLFDGRLDSTREDRLDTAIQILERGRSR